MELSSVELEHVRACVAEVCPDDPELAIGPAAIPDARFMVSSSLLHAEDAWKAGALVALRNHGPESPHRCLNRSGPNWGICPKHRVSDLLLGLDGGCPFDQ